MLPSDDLLFRTKIHIARQNIEISRQQLFGRKHVDKRAEPNERANSIPEKASHPEPGLNNVFWREVNVGGDNPRLPTKISQPYPTLNDGKFRPTIEIGRDKEIEKFAEKCSNACNFWDAFEQGRRKEMVRVGEFSPQNPNLQTTGRSLLGLGEYEERRRQLLHKKRQEYHEELVQIAQVQKSMALKNVSPVKPQKETKECSTQTDLSLVSPGQPFSVDVQSSTAQTKPTALIDVQTTTPSLLPPPLVPGLSINTPRSQSPSSPDKRFDPTVSDNLLLVVQNVKVESYSVLPDIVTSESSNAVIFETAEGGGLSDARLRQLRHQEDLRRQIEEKQRLDAERREREAREEEALLRRVAEQQARLQAEYEEEERLRRQKELDKKFQTEEFLRRQEQLLLESEQLKQETRRKRMEALNALADPQLQPPDPVVSNQKLSEQQILVESAPVPQEQAVEHKKERKKEKKTTGKERPGRNALSVPSGPAAPISILKSVSPPPRSPREATVIRADEPLEQPSPRALIKVLEGPTYRRPQRKPMALEDSLPIPLLRQARTPPSQRFPPVQPTRSNPNSAVIQPSEAMQRVEDKWKVPAVQKNVMTKRKVGQWGDANQSHVVLTQLGSFRRQLQEEHMRMQEQMHDFERQPGTDEKTSERQAVS